MRSTEIIRKALNKAEAKGFKLSTQMSNLSLLVAEGGIDERVFVRALVFDPEFAKAFWGDSYYGEGIWFHDMKNWEAHLQKAVLEENLLAYLERHL